MNKRDYDTVATVAAAAYIAQWDGTNWSALGSDVANNGSLNCDAFALRVSGDNLAVGGCFTDVKNNGSTLPEADYVAVYHILRQKLYLPVVQRP